MAHGRGNARSVMLVLGLFVVSRIAMAEEFTVGGRAGWDFVSTSTFYSDWAAGIKLVPGDKLVFKYFPIGHDVQEVSKVDYTSCNILNPINRYQTGNDVITLANEGTYYFICGFLGHCNEGGMLMKVIVREAVVATPPMITTPLQSSPFWVPSPPYPPTTAPSSGPLALQPSDPVVDYPIMESPSGIEGGSNSGSPATYLAPDSSVQEMLPMGIRSSVASFVAALVAIFL